MILKESKMESKMCEADSRRGLAPRRGLGIRQLIVYFLFFLKYRIINLTLLLKKTLVFVTLLLDHSSISKHKQKSQYDKEQKRKGP